jgi:hypothetical protein
MAVKSPLEYLKEQNIPKRVQIYPKVGVPTVPLRWTIDVPAIVIDPNLIFFDLF